MNTTIRYSPWKDSEGGLEPCRSCRSKGRFACGVVQSRRVIGRDDETYSEYKVYCRFCGKETGVHRSKLLAERVWAAQQEPEDRLPHRNRNREAG